MEPGQQTTRCRRGLPTSTGLRHLRHVLAILLAAASVPAAERVLVVELFSSQVCPSCPTANAVLADLSQGDATLLPLDLHVTCLGPEGSGELHLECCWLGRGLLGVVLMDCTPLGARCARGWCLGPVSGVLGRVGRPAGRQRRPA